jgi:hypothetical protein
MKMVIQITVFTILGIFTVLGFPDFYTYLDNEQSREPRRIATDPPVVFREAR